MEFRVMTEYDKQWQLQYEKMVEFKLKNGHCIVTKGCNEKENNKALGVWVARQRYTHASNKMRQDRKALLDEIGGFVWNVIDYEWHLQYEKLVDFKRKNNHCMVPTRYMQDKSLGQWVAKQRNLSTKDAMPQDRKDLLDELRFVWKVEKADDWGSKWNKQYERLVDFKQKNGNCLVPFMYKHDVPLSTWVSTQRQSHAKNKLRPDRKELLDALEFVWKADSVATRRSTATATTDDSDLEAFTGSVGLPNRAALLKETEPAQDHVRTRSTTGTTDDSDLEAFTPRSVGLPNREALLKETEPGQDHDVRNRSECTSCCTRSTLDPKADGRDEEDPKPPLVTSSVRIVGSDPDQEVVQEEATLDVLPPGWTRTKLEPDW